MFIVGGRKLGCLVKSLTRWYGKSTNAEYMDAG